MSISFKTQKPSVQKILIYLPGDIAALICLEAAQMQLTSGIFLMNHSPRVRTEVPNHDDMKTPTKNMKVMEVMNPRPAVYPNQAHIEYCRQRKALAILNGLQTQNLLGNQSIGVIVQLNEDD